MIVKLQALIIITTLQVEVGSMSRLTAMFSMLGTVGDQDWLTLLGWARPELFHVLGCEYNKQVGPWLVAVCGM